MNSRTIFYLTGMLFLLSCSNENNLLVSIGDNFINPQTTVALVDSFSVKMSTVLIDSIPTSATGVLMVGKYYDEQFGQVGSTGYFQLGFPGTQVPDEDEIFDSLVVVLPYNGVSYGDTLLPQTIYVNRVLQDIEPAEDEYYLYNTTSFKYSGFPLGALTFTPKPNFHDEIEIRLADELGKEFLDLMKDDGDEVNSDDDFIEYFKGLALVSGEGNTSVLSFTADSLLKMILYTHLIAEEKIEKSYTFSHLSLTHFNQITTDRSGTPIEYLETQRIEILSGDSGNKAFLQAGAGIVTRIDFPNIGRLLEIDYRNILYKAELVLKPYTNSYNQVDLPNELVLYETDKYNNLVTELVDDEGATVTAEFYYDEYYNKDTYYLFDVTSFISNELSDGYVNTDNGLIVIQPISQFQSSLNRVVFDARNNLSYRPVLNLYFILYN